MWTSALIQVAVILAASRLVGWIFRKAGQSQVMGEMTAGILLGPSLLGWLSPELSAALFPEDMMPVLAALSQLGLVLFLFLLGLESDVAQLRGRQHVALLTSHASIALPFALGTMLALLLYPRFSDASVPFRDFALFMGLCMSITAFPVLARILEERGLVSTTVGSMAIVCAAVDDVTGWFVVAAVLLTTRGTTALPLWLMGLGTLLYILAMLTVVRVGLRTLLARFRAYEDSSRAASSGLLAAVLLVVLVSAWLTERLGLHALFGAFVAGLVMPKEVRFIHAVRAKIRDLTVVLLLPLFFALSGLRTRLDILTDVESWFWFAVVLAIAIAGKLGGAMLAGRASQLPWREAAGIGVLVNARGLMELVVLNIGVDIGVISPRLFTIMVLMAIATTLMTGPLLELIYPLRRAAPQRAPADIGVG